MGGDVHLSDRVDQAAVRSVEVPLEDIPLHDAELEAVQFALDEIQRARSILVYHSSRIEVVHNTA